MMPSPIVCLLGVSKNADLLLFIVNIYAVLMDF